MLAAIDTYEGADAIFTFGPDSFGTVAFFVIAVVAFLGFLARVAIHENHAYAAMSAHATPERGPAVEGEPEVPAS